MAGSSKVEEITSAYRHFQKISQELESNRQLAKDPSEEVELRELALEEIKTLEEQSNQLTHQLELLLLPKDPDDTRNTILEIRAGTGGEEAALFARDLFRMYVRFAESQKWAWRYANSCSILLI